MVTPIRILDISFYRQLKFLFRTLQRRSWVVYTAVDDRQPSSGFHLFFPPFPMMSIYSSHLPSPQQRAKVKRDKGESEEETDLSSVLLAFLEFYGRTFDYHTYGISIRNGGFFFVKVRVESNVRKRMKTKPYIFLPCN